MKNATGFNAIVIKLIVILGMDFFFLISEKWIINILAYRFPSMHTNNLIDRPPRETKLNNRPRQHGTKINQRLGGFSSKKKKRDTRCFLPLTLISFPQVRSQIN